MERAMKVTLSDIAAHLTNGEIVDYVLEAISDSCDVDRLADELLHAFASGFLVSLKDEFLEQQSENDYLISRINAAAKENNESAWREDWE